MLRSAASCQLGVCSLVVFARGCGCFRGTGRAYGAPKFTPLGPDRFKLQLTMDRETYDQLEQLQDLLRHQNPSGDLAPILARALRELRERTLKQRFAQPSAPRQCKPRVQTSPAPPHEQTPATQPSEQTSLAQPREQTPSAQASELASPSTTSTDAPHAAKSRDRQHGRRIRSRTSIQAQACKRQLLSMRPMRRGRRSPLTA
jgi:hypothetical protein